MTCLYSFYPRYVTLKGADKQTIQQNAESITSANFDLRDFLSANRLVFPMPLKEIPFTLFQAYSEQADDTLLAFLTPDDGGWVCYYNGKLNLFDTRKEMNDHYYICQGKFAMITQKLVEDGSFETSMTF